MSAEDPASLPARYDATTGGDGYAAFSRLALRLPGAGLAGNAPEVRIENGPCVEPQGDRRRALAIAGERAAHRHGTTAVIGHN